MKPGADCTWATTLPHDVASSAIAATATGSVSSPRTTSTRRIAGTGLKKCMPTTRDGAAVRAAISVIDSEEVLVARIASSPKCSRASAKTDSFTSRFSTTASITTVAGSAGTSRTDAAVRNRVSRVSAIPGCLRCSRARMSAAAASSWPRSGSTRLTGCPAATATWAMPRPIVPAPITQMCAVPSSWPLPSRCRCATAISFSGGR